MAAMQLRWSRRLAVFATVLVAAGAGATAQGALAQLGLTETVARNFVMSEAESTSTNRRTPIVETGRRAFYKLPPAARGAAATALFAWAKAYVGSAAFKTAYAQHRRDVIGPDVRPAQPSIDELVQQRLNEMKESLAQSRQMAASLPPANAATLLKTLEEQEARINSGEFEKILRTGLEIEQADSTARDTASSNANDERYPADPTRIFVRRLREFLDATADVNFSARTISLTGGADGIEFLDKADRQRNWMWQEAVIVGPEATSAARAAAQAWLKEIQP
jgi:predicted transcriptional regulator